MVCATLVVSAAAVVGGKAYNHSQLTDLALANIEALSNNEFRPQYPCFQMYKHAPVLNHDLALLLRICDSCNEHWLEEALSPSYCQGKY